MLAIAAPDDVDEGVGECLALVLVQDDVAKGLLDMPNDIICRIADELDPTSLVCGLNLADFVASQSVEFVRLIWI